MALSFKLTKANYDAMRSMSMTQRMQVAKNDEVGQWLLSLMSPTQLAELFPLYYQRMLPADISGFMKAMPTSMTMAKQRAVEEQLQNTASGASAGANMQAGGWRRKWQESMTAAASKKVTPQLSEEQQKIYSELKSGPMSIDDPRAKMFAGLNEQQLASVGVKRITQDGKDFFKYTVPTVSEEEQKAYIKEQASMGSGKKYSNAQAAALIRSIGGTEEEAANLGALVHQESSGIPTKHNPNRSTGDNSYGLWQINMIENLEEKRLREFAKFGVTKKEDLFNPVINAKVALHMYRAKAAAGRPPMEDWGAWKVAYGRGTNNYWRQQYELSKQGASGGVSIPGGDSITADYSDKNMKLARERLIRNLEAQRIGTLAEYTNAGLPAPGSPEAKAIVGDARGVEAVKQRIEKEFGNLSNPQCVALAKAYVGATGSVRDWRRGTNVMDGTLKPGTPIATFLDRKGNPSPYYDGGQGVGIEKNNTTHAAVFLDYKRDGSGKIIAIRVMEQFKGSHGARERTYPVGGFGTHNAANYHSINNKDGAPLGSNNPMVQNAAVDPPKTPNDVHTSKMPQAPAVAPPKPVEAKPDNKDNTPPPKKVKANAKGGINKINTEQITAYPIGGAQGDNAVVVNAQQQPLFTMNTNEKMLIDPKSDTAQVIPDQKPQMNQPPQQDMTTMMDEFKATIQELKNQFSQNDPGNFAKPEMPDRDTLRNDTAHGHVLNDMNDLSKEYYSTPSMKRAAFRTGGVETGDPVSNFHYSHGNKS